MSVISSPMAANPMLKAMARREPIRPARVPAVSEKIPVSQRRYTRPSEIVGSLKDGPVK